MQNDRYSGSQRYGRYPAHNSHGSARKAQPRPSLGVLLALDLAGVAAVVGIFCAFYFMIPRSIDTKPVTLPGSSIVEQQSPSTAENPSQEAKTASTTASPSGASTPNSASNTGDQGMWGAKFASQFATGSAETTDHSYKSKDISVTIQKNQKNGITWYVADIYVRNLQNFKTAFAQNQFGKGIAEPTLDMATGNNAIVAVSGDFYGNHETGIVVRNGQLYRKSSLNDVLIMNNDGSMQTFSSQSFRAADVVKNGAWQAWSFGPMLLDNGQPMTSFQSNVNPANPRTAIGYYEPGHYCLVVVDGRQPGYSNGISLKDFSQLFADMGCKAAYNLDGGQTAEMVFMGKVINQPYNGGRNCSDIVYIGDTTK